MDNLPRHWGIAVLFLASNLLGLAAGIQLHGMPGAESIAGSYGSPGSGAVFFGILILATALLLLLYRYSKQLLVKLWFGSALAVTGLIFFDIFLPAIPALVVAAAFLIARLHTSNPVLRSALDTIPFAGAGALFGTLLGFRAVLVFGGLLAVYDYIAVNRLGHMVTLAKESVSTGTFMGFNLYEDGDAPARDDVDTGERDTESEQDQKSIGMLGGGDVILPIMLSVSVLPLFGTGAAISAVAGSVTALLAFFHIVSERETEAFYPAIPVVGSGALIGTGLYLAISII